jgi:broad specificity phosphatase PhoE
MSFNKVEDLFKMEQKEFGSNIKATLEFKRHQDPGKDPVTGMSADFLTEKGQAASVSDGQKVEDATVKGYASPKLRAQETVDLMLQNTDDDVRVINRTSESLRGTKAENLVNNQRGVNEFNIRTRKELDAVVNFGKVVPLASVWAEEQIKEGAKLDKYSLIVQWYLDNPLVCQENEVLTGHETAVEIAERVSVELGMTERLHSGSEVRLVNVTHGPKIEPFLQEVIGFKNLSEIGGALQPGESIKFKVSIDANKKKEVKLLFRDEEYVIDEEQITTLSQEYRDRIERENNKS